MGYFCCVFRKAWARITQIPTKRNFFLHHSFNNFIPNSKRCVTGELRLSLNISYLLMNDLLFFSKKIKVCLFVECYNILI